MNDRCRDRARRWGGWRDDRGMVTAETAVVVPSLVVLLVLLLWGVAAVTAQMRCVDAARAGARALARGETADASHAAAVAAAPRGAAVDMRREDDLVHVQISVPVRPPGPVLSWLPGVSVSGEAAALAEETHASPP